MIHWFSKYEYAVILAKVLLCIGCQFSIGAPTALGLRKTVQTSSYNSQQICKLFYFSSHPCNLYRNDGENLNFDHVFLLPFDEFKNTEENNS